MATSFDQDKWELYNTDDDFSCAIDLATKFPDKLKELQAIFLEEAIKHNVLPLDDRTYQRFNAALAGRPDLMGGRTSLTVYPGMIGMKEDAFINVKNRSHSITAEVEIPKTGAAGVLIAQGGTHAGWSLYVKDGKTKFAYNYLVLLSQKVAGDCHWELRKKPRTKKTKSRRMTTELRDGDAERQSTTSLLARADEVIE